MSPSQPVYALVDVYGTTKQVKIIPLSNQGLSFSNQSNICFN